MLRRIVSLYPLRIAAIIVLASFVLSLLVGLPGPRVGDSAWQEIAARFSLDGSLTYVRDSDGGRAPAVIEAYRPPGYAVLLSISNLIFGSKFGSPILGAILACITCATVIALGVLVYRWSVGIAAGIVTAMFPYTLFHFQATIDTPLYTAALLGMVLGALLSDQRPLLSPVLVILCGSIATLTRPTGIVAVLVVLLFLVIRRHWIASSISALGIGGLVGAWCLYVSSKVGAPTFVATNGGWNLWLGNNEHTLRYVISGRSLDRIEFDGVTDMTVTEGMSEAEESSYFQNRAIEWATDNPLDLLKLVAAKGVVTLLPIARAFESLPKALLLFVTAIPFYVGSVIQAVRYRSPAQWLLIGIIAQAVVVNLVTLPYTRTLSPVFPILILMGCALFVAHRPKRHSTGIDADSDINSNSSPINHGTRRPPVQ